MKIKQYKTIVRLHQTDFDDKVNQFLNQGWELYGSPYSDKNHFYCQALVLKEKEVNHDCKEMIPCGSPLCDYCNNH